MAASNFKLQTQELTTGDRVVVTTNRDIKTISTKVLKNDILTITGIRAKGGYFVEDALGCYLGFVRASDIKPY